MYSVRMPEELMTALDALKVRDGISESEAIRRGTSEYLERRGIRVAAPKRGGTRPKRSK
jgi:metal-responsive CopG/Arc/MetJ family transcriptional regulator